MRGVVHDLASPHPIGLALPSLYADDGLAQRFTAALDDVLAPIFSTLDCLTSYLDPRLAPPDFVDWLASWLGLALDESWPVERRRMLVARAKDLHRRRGTRAGLVEHLELVLDGTVEVADGGGVTWSTTPGSPLPGSDGAIVVVTVRVADPATVDRPRLEALVAALVPAHLPHAVEVASG